MSHCYTEAKQQFGSHRNTVVAVADTLLPVAVLGLPIVRAMLLPVAPLLALLPMLFLLGLHFDPLHMGLLVGALLLLTAGLLLVRVRLLLGVLLLLGLSLPLLFRLRLLLLLRGLGIFLVSPVASQPSRSSREAKTGPLH
jgi:hypothetical protein